VSLSSHDLERFVNDLAARPGLWRDYVTADATQRVYELIWDDADVNAWIICWADGSDTGFHDHDRSAAAITVLAGEVTEERLRLGAPPRRDVHGAGTTFTLPATAIHRIRHDNDELAISIHAYSPPLVRTGAYRTGEDGLLEREAQGIEAELRAEPAAVAA